MLASYCGSPALAELFISQRPVHTVRLWPHFGGIPVLNNVSLLRTQYLAAPYHSAHPPLLRSLTVTMRCDRGDLENPGVEKDSAKAPIGSEDGLNAYEGDVVHLPGHMYDSSGRCFPPRFQYPKPTMYSNPLILTYSFSSGAVTLPPRLESVKFISGSMLTFLDPSLEEYVPPNPSFATLHPTVSGMAGHFVVHSTSACLAKYADPWLLRDPERLKAYKLVYPHWPRPPMRHPWSTDWQYWEFGDRVAKWAKEWPRSYTYHIDTTGMTPLAFLPKQPEPIFMFTAAGEYYWCNMGDLLRFNARFAGHDDFAERLASEMGNVTSMPWGPGHNNDVSDEILEERARLLEEWNEELKK
ncbi:hypothetical protein C8R47DRAFT_1221480 [Mycena vitilis]|nr:hypothetical protein C8R47DRAFT_1221480 [Mycena vitilis]